MHQFYPVEMCPPISFKIQIHHDATLKLKHMSNIGEFKQDFGSPMIEVKIDKKNSKIHIIDHEL